MYNLILVRFDKISKRLHVCACPKRLRLMDGSNDSSINFPRFDLFRSDFQPSDLFYSAQINQILYSDLFLVIF